MKPALAGTPLGTTQVRGMFPTTSDLFARLPSGASGIGAADLASQRKAVA
jgi:hypothetical protein